MKVCKLDEDSFLPTVKNPHDAGMDFYSLEDYVIESGNFQICKTGITIEIPPGIVGLLKPKGKNDWLIGAGVVDYTYQGEVLFKIFNVSKHSKVIRAGDALGQMIFVRNIEPTVEEVKPEYIHQAKTARGITGGIVTQAGVVSWSDEEDWIAE